MLVQGKCLASGRGCFSKAKDFRTLWVELPSFAQRFDAAAWLKVRVDLDEGFRPILLRCVLCIHKGADVVCLDACEAACELSVLVDQCLAKFKNVQSNPIQCYALMNQLVKPLPAQGLWHRKSLFQAEKTSSKVVLRTRLHTSVEIGTAVRSILLPPTAGWWGMVDAAR